MEFITKAVNSFGEEVPGNLEQSWDNFESVCKNRKLFIFGAGAGIGLYTRRIGDKIHLDGIIDNDKKKQGRMISEMVPETLDTQWGKMEVSDISVLAQYKQDEIVVLIASLKYYEEITNQLKPYKVCYIFAAVIMEVNEVCGREPIQLNKIVFKSFGTYSDHGKYITEELLKRKKDIDIVWIVNDLYKEIPDGVRLVLATDWKQFIYEMETAHIWVINTIIPAYLRKRKDQIYIHTKHWASVTLKKFYLDALTITDVPEDVALWQFNGENIDYMITGSKFDEESCRRGFRFHKQFIDAGSPRSDAMFQPERNKKKVCDIFNISYEKKILLYAPTYRYKQENTSKHIVESRNCELDYGRVKEALETKFGGEWYILLRLHPSVAKESKNMMIPEYVRNASDYEDSEELCSACDVMISDYSSIMFEMAFVNKPVFLFATDKKEYIDKEYNLLIGYDELPFPIAESNDELVHSICVFSEELYQKRITQFLKQYGVHEDGHASERAADFMLQLL